jgi:hypothetical protein
MALLNDLQLTGTIDDMARALAVASEQFVVGGVRWRDNGRRARLLSPSPLENVVGVGLAEKQTARCGTGLAAVTFFVNKKYSEPDVPDESRLPPKVNGVPSDVVETGEFWGLAGGITTGIPVFPDRLRPIQPGCSIGPNTASNVTGTLAAIVRSNGDPSKLFLLSNNHVFTSDLRTPPLFDILQPGTMDSLDVKPIATLHSSFAMTDPPGLNEIDAAIALVLRASDVDETNTIVAIGAPTGVATAFYGQTVQKHGRMTGLTTGTVQAPTASITVRFLHRDVVFHNQVMIKADTDGGFARSGDSGALIVDKSTRAAIGLLFAGNDEPSAEQSPRELYALANDFGTVLRLLNVSLR